MSTTSIADGTGERTYPAAESKVWSCPRGCGYHIADGPVEDGDLPTSELIREHLEEHGPTDAQRAARDLRLLADFLDANPDLPGSLAYAFDSIHIFPSSRDEVAVWARAAMRAHGSVHKHLDSETWAGLDVTFGEVVKLRVRIERQEVCERVVIGTREVTEEVPDPVAVAALPKVAVTTVVEDVEWRCMPLLDGVSS
jgi:hypothetical protein